MHSTHQRAFRTFAVATLAWTALPALHAQTPDTTAAKTFFIGRDALFGVALVGVSAGVSIFDPRLTRFFRDTTMAHVREGRRLANDFTHVNETTLTVGGLAIWAVGRATGSRMVADVAFHTAESVAAASLVSQVIRGPLGRVRPINGDPQYDDQYKFQFFKGFTHFENRAFPSIHSSSGFAAASAIVAEVHERSPGATWAVAVPAYALAMTPGLSRMYLGQHWASDIVSGAMLGTFFGWRVVNYSHSHPTTLTDRIFLGAGDRAHFSFSPGGASMQLTF